MSTIEERFSLKNFGMGMGVVALVYVLIFTYAGMSSSKTIKALEGQLASQTVLIDRPVIVERPPAPVEATEHSTEKPHGEAATAEEEDFEEVVSRQSLALRDAPLDGFYEETPDGLLPIAKSPIQTPFHVYRKPYLLNLEKPFIALAVQDFGLSDELSAKMIEELPSTVTFILSPYSNAPEEWTKKARADGHEIWLNLPIENKNFPLQDPGAKGLLTRVSLQYNKERLQWLLGRSVGYAGIAAFTDSALKNANTTFDNMARDVFGRGLGYFELSTGDDSFFKPVADALRIPRIQNTGLIEVVDPQHPEMKAALGRIKDQGGTILTVAPSPRNISNLARWIEVLQKRGIESIPLSAIAAPDTERN